MRYGDEARVRVWVFPVQQVRYIPRCSVYLGKSHRFNLPQLLHRSMPFESASSVLPTLFFILVYEVVSDFPSS